MHNSVDTHSHKENAVRHRFNRLSKPRALCVSLSPIWLELRRLPQILLVLDFWVDVRSINTKLVTFYST